MSIRIQLTYRKSGFKKPTSSFFDIIEDESYTGDMFAAYLTLALSVAVALLNTDIRSPKTYWNLLLPIPIAIVIPLKIQVEKEIRQKEQKYVEKEQSQPEVCKGCQRFDFLKVDDLNYCCKLHPGGIPGNSCDDYQTEEQRRETWEIEHQARLKAYDEAREKVKHLKPSFCEGCLNYCGVDSEFQPMICYKYPDGIQGNKCKHKYTDISELKSWLW